MIDQTLARTAIANAAVAGALALMACGVAAQAFGLENGWTLSASLIVAATSIFLSVHNILIARRRRKGMR